MSTLLMSKADQAICDEFDLYEYGISHLVTMPNNYKFIIYTTHLSAIGIKTLNLVLPGSDSKYKAPECFSKIFPMI